MRSQSKYFDELREYCETIGLVDCHDHSTKCEPKYEDPIAVINSGYFCSDLWSALSDEEYQKLSNSQLSLEDRWSILENTWKRTSHTGYGQVTRRVLKKFYGVEKLTLDALKSMQDKLPDLTDETAFDSILEEANIAVRLENVMYDHCFDPVNNLMSTAIKAVLDGSAKLSPRGRLVIPLVGFHHVLDYASIQNFATTVGETVTNLDEYLNVCRKIFEGYKKFGAVAFKDQSAYNRKIEFGNPTRSEAEAVFNRLMIDPRRSASYPDGIKPLDDFLFHEFMRMAREMDLPVQIHTGHMAGIRNEITKTNAIGLTSVLELHQDVRFDLFHANWPYSGELLFLGKNYPNVAIDFCWANIIDPIYCQNLFKQALSCVPHGKIHGYGSDYDGQADRAWAHASIARENIAIALSDMIDAEYLDIDDAKEIALMWLRENPNEFFRLGL